MNNSALVIIELYKIRTGQLMREARAWFVSEFAPQSGREIVQLMLSGEKQSSYYRMVASYWESAASLVNNGGIDQKMFLDANTEHLVVFAKLEPFISEVREMISEPDYLSQLERLVMKVPNLQKKLENRRTLLERWHQAGATTN
jgi:L-rhamnose mutarotase